MIRAMPERKRFFVLMCSLKKLVLFDNNYDDDYGRNDDDDGDVDVVAHLLKQLVLPPLTFGLKPVERLPDVVDLVFH